MLSNIKIPVLLTGLYYLIVFPVVIYMAKSGNFSGGPCNPGLDLVAYFFAFLTSVVLLLIYIGLLIKGGKRHLPVVLIHLAAICGWIILLFI
jgi:hypothetical protein